MTVAKPHTYADEMAALDVLTPETHSARDATHFRRIIAARKALTDAEADLVAAVEAARGAGDSWTVIGAALGMTRQGAFRKFGHAGGGEVVPIKRSAESAVSRVRGRSAPRSHVVAAQAPKGPAAAPAKVAAKATTIKAAAATRKTTKVAKATPTKAARAVPTKQAKATPTKRAGTKTTTKAAANRAPSSQH